jgi:anti-sigma factor ChrR (cupin superfamily)
MTINPRELDRLKQQLHRGVESNLAQRRKDAEAMVADVLADMTKELTPTLTDAVLAVWNETQEAKAITLTISITKSDGASPEITVRKSTE